MFSHDVECALRAALDAHADQARKGSDVPYVVHPIHAALMLARLGADDLTITAAILHDVVEDSADWTLARVEDEFGVEVRVIVAELTEDKALAWEDRKQSAVDDIARMSQEARLVKAADKLHNLSTLLEDLRDAEHHDDVWKHFSRGPFETVPMSRALVEALVPRVEARIGEALIEALEALEREISR